jgi:catechol 2,3-dioxygenase-like lactoylglutathione lyase family enzyme
MSIRARVFRIDKSESIREDLPVSRVQLALNVSDLDEAVDFYAKLFQAEPAKRREGYANFAIDTPPLKLVLIENSDAAGRLNHLGVEVFSTDEVTAAQARLAGDGLATATEEGVTCCYAQQDKVWVDDPDGAPWEIYTVLADSDVPHGDVRRVDVCGAGACATTDLPADQTSGPSVSGCC